MEDLKENNLTIESLVCKNQELEKQIIELEAQLQLMKELFEKYHR